jgi:predicted nucleotidyltransferase
MTENDKILADTVNKALKEYGYDILGIYPYGSFVYGSFTEYSDNDFIVIVDNDECVPHVTSGFVELNIYTRDEFEGKLYDHDIDAIEVYSTKPIYKNNYRVNFNLDLQKLRKSISYKSNHAFVKAKKKITLAHEDNHIGCKSLFHSLRIVMFGIQIARYGGIINFGEANHIMKELYNKKSYIWEDLKKEYKPQLNKLMTEFRILAPKE